MISCRQASVLLSLAQERNLNWWDRLGLRLHLLICDSCSNFRRQLELIRLMIRRYRDDDTRQ
jgi:Putative zinc-finger